MRNWYHPHKAKIQIMKRFHSGSSKDNNMSILYREHDGIVTNSNCLSFQTTAGKLQSPHPISHYTHTQENKPFTTAASQDISCHYSSPAATWWWKGELHTMIGHQGFRSLKPPICVHNFHLMNEEDQGGVSV